MSRIAAESNDAAEGILRRLVGPRPSPDAVGRATVELDRAEREVIDAIFDHEPVVSGTVEDPLLGARCRVVSIDSTTKAIVLLEPATEGRIAASLARFGEDYVATWIRVPPARFDDIVEGARGEGLRLSSEAAGPFGRERLLLGGPAWGPHLLVSEIDAIWPAPGAATIEP